MAQFQDVKAGDLIITKYHIAPYNGQIHSEAVVIGLPTGKTHSGGHLGLNGSKIPAGIMCYRRFPGIDSGYFVTLNEEQWDNGGKADYTPLEQGKDISKRLLESAKSDLTQPVYKGLTLKDLGLTVYNAAEVLQAIEGLL
jgi:hypothetical protein